MPKSCAFAPTGGRPVDLALMPPAPAEAAALDLGDGVDPPPAQKTCTMPTMEKPEYT